MRLADPIRQVLARLRLREAEDVARRVDAADDARRRGPDPGDPSQGVPHPPHDPSSWTGVP